MLILVLEFGVGLSATVEGGYETGNVCRILPHIYTSIFVMTGQGALGTVDIAFTEMSSIDSPTDTG
jgi:hypothetical protein